MGIYLADSFKKNLAKKREEFLRLRCERKGKEKNKGRGGRKETEETDFNGCTLSLYIGYFGLTEEVSLAERFQESARFRISGHFFTKKAD